MEGRLGLSEVGFFGRFLSASGGSLGAQSELYCVALRELGLPSTVQYGVLPR